MQRFGIRKEKGPKSVVAVSWPPEKYTDEEIQKLYKFSVAETERYDKRVKTRVGANLIVFDKYEDGQWLRKRLTWEIGEMTSETLNEAIEVFTKD